MFNKWPMLLKLSSMFVFVLLISFAVIQPAFATLNCPSECKCRFIKGELQIHCIVSRESEQIVPDLVNLTSADNVDQIGDLRIECESNINNNRVPNSRRINSAIFCTSNAARHLFINNCDVSSLRYTPISCHESSPSTNFKTLDLQNNNVLHLDSRFLQSVPNLEELNLRDNALGDLGTGTFRNNVFLSSLRVDKNRLTEIKSDFFTHSQSLRHLNMAENKIFFICPQCFFYLNNLETLNLTGNSLLDLPDNLFSQMRRLRTLDLSHNRVPTISINTFKGLYNLKTLLINNNYITTFPKTSSTVGPFHHLESLEIFDCSFNRLSFLPNYIFYRQNKTIQEVRASNNRITALGSLVFLSGTKMRYFGINNNRITRLLNSGPFFRATIDEINLENNLLSGNVVLSSSIIRGTPDITVVRLSGNFYAQLYRRAINAVRFKRLDLSYNRIHFFFPLESMRLSTINELDFTGNQNLTYLPPNFSRSSVIRKLNLAGTGIRTINSRIMRQFGTHLEELDLSHNTRQPVSFSNFTFTHPIKIIAKGTNFTSLDFLNTNIISEIQTDSRRLCDYLSSDSRLFANFESISVGMCSNLNITVPMTSNLTNISISNSTIEQIDIDSKSVKRLNINGSTLKPNAEFRFHPESKFVNLSIYETSVQSLDFLENIGSVEHLTCYSCKLKHMMTYLPKSLRILDLNNNLIESLVPERKLFNRNSLFSFALTLVSFTISDNRIESIENYAFKGASLLSYIDLRKNKIKWLSQNAFTGLFRLKVLLLSDNRISVLPNGVFPTEFLSLKASSPGALLDLGDNPLNCIDCQTRWFFSDRIRRDIAGVGQALEVRGTCEEPNDQTIKEVGYNLDSDTCHKPEILSARYSVYRGDDSTSLRVVFYCVATGSPSPSVSWRSASGDILATSSITTRVNQTSESVVAVSYTTNFDSQHLGLECIAKNIAGSDSMSTGGLSSEARESSFQNSPVPNSYVAILVVGIILILAALFIIALLVYLRLKRRVPPTVKSKPSLGLPRPSRPKSVVRSEGTHPVNPSPPAQRYTVDPSVDKSRKLPDVPIGFTNQDETYMSIDEKGKMDSHYMPLQNS